jgi:hypothetical protein
VVRAFHAEALETAASLAPFYQNMYKERRNEERNKEATHERMDYGGPYPAGRYLFEGRDNGTTEVPVPDVARDVVIAEGAGYRVIVNCKPSQDDAKDKIKTAVENLIADSAYIAELSYITSLQEFKITIEAFPKLRFLGKQP